MLSVQQYKTIGLLAAVCLGLHHSPLHSDDTDEPQIEYRVAHVSAGSGGVYTYAAGDWGLLRVQLANHNDHPVDLECATYFDSEPTLQYGRRIWLPAHSRIITWHPIYLPSTDEQETRVPFHTQVSEVGRGADGLVADEIGKLQFSSDLQVVQHRPVTGVIQPYGVDLVDDGVSVFPADVIRTARIELQTPAARQVSNFGDRLLPPSELGLASLQQLLIADDRMLGDAEALSAIRRWLYAGGRLWVMLDRVDPALLSALLGDESRCQVVDTVTLNQLNISSTREYGSGDYSAEHERPVTLVRVLVDDVEVPLLANGWPAAFWQDCGRGRLLVTTLESTAWVTRKTVEEMNVRDGDEPSWPFKSIPSLEELVGPFFSQLPEDSTVSQTLEPQVREYVGYQIPSQWLVTGLLGLSVILLASIGLWLLRNGALERLAIAIPAVTIVVAGGLVLIGRQNRQVIPPSTAMIQVVHPIPGTDDVRILGSAGLYHSDAVRTVIGGTDGGWIVPELSGTEGTVRRMMWSDLGQWEWEGVQLPPGLRIAESETSSQSPERVSARAVFGPEGLSGMLSTSEYLEPRDAVLITNNGRMGVELDETGAFTADSDNVLGADEFLIAGLLSDDQTRRSRILANLLQQSEIGRVNKPTLFFWTNPWDAGFRFADESQRSGSALVAIPLEFERPAVGTSVSLPWPLLPYREATGPDGYRPSGLFDNRDLVWLAKPRPAMSWLRVQVPRVLLPVDIESGRIVARVTGPVGKLELSVAHGSEIVPLHTWIDPVGTLTLDLEGSELPTLDETGGMLIRVAAGDADRPELYEPDPESGKLNYWRIESLTMELNAVVLEREPGASP